MSTFYSIAASNNLYVAATSSSFAVSTNDLTYATESNTPSLSAVIGYKNYFNISNTGRVDNLSTLPSGNNTFFYPSVALSTNLVDYLSLPSTISYFKLRGSYAEVKGALTTAQAQFAAARQDLIVRLGQAYFDALSAQDSVAIVRSQKASMLNARSFIFTSPLLNGVTVPLTEPAQARLPADGEIGG